MAKGLSLSIGLNSVDPKHYGGWAGELNACEADAAEMSALAKSQGFRPTVLLTRRATRAPAPRRCATARCPRTPRCAPTA